MAVDTIKYHTPNDIPRNNITIKKHTYKQMHLNKITQITTIIQNRKSERASERETHRENRKIIIAERQKTDFYYIFN